MANTPRSELLPVLPMDDVVVLPHMTVTLAVDGDSQRAAIAAARQGSGQADIGGALWVKADPINEPEPPSERAQELAREYRAMLENLVESRGVPQVVQFLRAARTPGQLADLAGYSPDLSTEQKLEILEMTDLEERLTKLISWTKGILADASLKEKIRSDVAEGMEKTQRE